MKNKNHQMRLKNMFFIAFFYAAMAQCVAQNQVTISGLVKDSIANAPVPFANVVLNSTADSSLVAGTISNENGQFSLNNITEGNYYIITSMMGFKTKYTKLYIGELATYIDLGTLLLHEEVNELNEVVIISNREEVSAQLDKKTYNVSENNPQEGGSVLQAMQNLPGVSVQDGKVQLRGNENVTVLIDGKQTALTGFNGQNGLDNIPASAIEKIEIINNPSAKYQANGSAGIINIIYKKEKQEGFNGKVGMALGVGALWQKKENLPDIRPQYQNTPKINPSLSLNYRKNKINAFFQGDYIYKQTLNKNEFVDRYYDDGTIIHQQLKRNRNTGYATLKGGLDWQINDKTNLTISGLYGRENIIDNGDQPFFKDDFAQQYRLWQFQEDELKTTFGATAMLQHKFAQPGHLLQLGYTYTFHREDEKYFFTNIKPLFTGEDSFKLLSDERVSDLTADYVKPLKNGRLETGMKLRYRNIPTNMQFFPGVNSPLDSSAGGWATYTEIIPSMYGNYVLEGPKYEAELGLRMEFIDLKYEVNPNHPTYKSGGYHYLQPFPSIRLGYKINPTNKISLFVNRRVDQPQEVDIRIFPKYDDAEIIKVGNPNLQPQFTNAIELGYKSSFDNAYVYTALFGKFTEGTITRISTTVDTSSLIYAIYQNADKSYNAGVEMVFAHQVNSWFSYDVNLTYYLNEIDAFTVNNTYPKPHEFTVAEQSLYSGNAKINGKFKLQKQLELQVSAIYLAPDIIPQGHINARFSTNIALKKTVQNGKGEFFVNVSDLFNTMVIGKTIYGNGFYYTSKDYYETQVIRFGYSYKF